MAVCGKNSQQADFCFIMNFSTCSVPEKKSPSLGLGENFWEGFEIFERKMNGNRLRLVIGKCMGTKCVYHMFAIIDTAMKFSGFIGLKTQIKNTYHAI